MTRDIPTRYFVEESDDVSLDAPWGIQPEELSATGNASLQILTSSDARLALLAMDASWCSQALIEFQDLQGLPIPHEGRFFNTPYLFFEALGCLREVVLAGLNGQMHASFAALRSVLEMLVFQSWWKTRLLGAGSYEAFHEWLFGRRGAPPFKEVRDAVYDGLIIPPTARGKRELESVYHKLCAYAHKPLLQESIEAHRGGVPAWPSPELIRFWLESLVEALRCALDLCIAAAPQSMFPIALERKFGFYPPIGIYFDFSNFLPIMCAVGSDRVKEYTSCFGDQDPPKTMVESAESQPDMTDAEILAQWREEEPLGDDSDPEELRIQKGVAMMRAKSRALLRALAYSEKSPSIEELRDDSVDWSAGSREFVDPKSWVDVLSQDPGLVVQLSEQTFPPGTFGALLQEAIQLMKSSPKDNKQQNGE